MPDPQLTDRLRDACALPHEPRPGRAVGESLASRLPRYRNRRRAALSGSLGGVAVVLALVLVVALGGFSTGPPKAPPVASPDLQCVEVQVGGAQAHCSGHIYVSSASANATLSPSAAQGLGAGPSVPTVRIAPGRRITLSLPRRSGFTWSAVALRAQSATGPPGSGTTPVATIPGPHGRTIALIDHAPVGGYTLFALATPACGPGPSCSAGGLVWTIQLLVD